MFTSIFHEDLSKGVNKNSNSRSVSEKSTTTNLEVKNNEKSHFEGTSKSSHEHKRAKIVLSHLEECSKQEQNCGKYEDVQVICDSKCQNKPSQLSSFRSHENIFESSDPSSSIMKCRNEVDGIVNSCISEMLCECDKIRSMSLSRKSSSEVFNNRIENLHDQRKEFENFVYSIRTQLTITNVKNKDITMESIIESVQKEATLFRCFFPTYGLRQTILNEIKNHQVTIISADCTYFLNVTLPFMLSNVYPSHTLIACEKNEILSQILKERIDSIHSNNDLKLLHAQLTVLPEEQLLKRFSCTTLFAGANSCIIINIPLKRSVVTDIVLAHLRDLLLLQEHSKVILLLSPYDNASKFVEYFSPKLLTSLLELPQLSLPVKTVWKNAMLSTDDDLKVEVIKTVFSIHALCEPGDIIVFLPALEDVQHALEELNVKVHLYQYNNIHFFSVNEDNMDHFVHLNNVSSVRKVFLLINDWEGFAIPSVRYIIDCGLQRECQFDSQTDSHIYIPTFISKVRAKARKQLAGSSNVGTCFRLYNKVNYLKNMHPKEYSEMFCINPFHCIIKVFQHCPYKSKSVQFVESLPKDVLESIIRELKSFGAIDADSCVTSLGEDIIKIPLSVKNSKLILFGLKSGFVYEAIILVAFSFIKSDFFVESTDEQHQKQIDAMKFDFNQLDSDTLTFLNIFKLWKEAGFKKVWCSEKSVNFETLKSVRYKVNELSHLINNSLDIKIDQQFSDVYDQQTLVQMLFECFHYNLCVYTGHPRAGYHVLASQQFALIHPSSFLFKKQSYPDFIIYEDLLVSTDSKYIKNLTPVPFDYVMDYFHKGILNFNGSDLLEEKLDEKAISASENVISRVFLKNDGKKAREIENTIKKEVAAKIVIIEPDLEKGCVKIYAFPKDITNCIVSVSDILKNYIQAMTKEEEIKIIEFKKGQNSALIEVKLSKGAESLSATHVLVSTSQHNLKQNSCALVSEPEFIPKSSINYCLKISWLRRTCTGVGYIHFKDKNDFAKARMLSFKYIPVGECEVFVTVGDAREYQLLLTEVPPAMTDKDISSSFSKLIQCEFEVELCCQTPFETTCDELQNFKKQVEENCKNYSNINKFEVRVLMPELSAKFMTAYVDVFEERCLEREANNLSETKVNNRPLSCEPLYFSDMTCSTEVYEALKYCIKEELEIFNHEQVKAQGKKYSFKVIPNKDDVNFKLSCDDIEIMKSLQVLINHLLDGIKLEKRNLKDINKLFCHGGHVFLKTLEKTENVYIMANYETKTIRLFGLRKNCNYVRQYICNFLKDSENEIAKNVILSTGKQDRIILKSMITQYGANLESFIELCGLRSAALNIKTSCLSLYGRKESIEKAENCIKELSANIDPINVYSDVASDVEECPVCYNPAQNLTIRLQHCGHLYHCDCISGLIEQADFPIQCCEENCSKSIFLEDIKSVLDEDFTKFNNLAERSLKAYMEKHRDKIFYCPAADCAMFAYKTEIRENKWHCPLCKNFICIQCNVVYHEGYTCDMYRGSKADPDYSFKVWQKTVAQCKRCPKCCTAIEKKDGCNHMTCSSCRTHFCWLCVQAFSTGEEVYSHIQRTHLGQLY